MKDSTGLNYHVLTKWGAEYEITKEDWEDQGFNEILLEDKLIDFRDGNLILKTSEIAGFLAE